jgi:hypothetical protein
MFKIVFFIGTLLIALTLFLNIGPLIYNVNEYPMWKSKMDYISYIHKSENIIIGDSRAEAAFVPDILEDNFYNLSVGGGSPIDGYFILKKYLEKNKINILIISFSPKHLETVGTFFGRTLKYNLLSIKDIIQVFSKSLELNENLDATDEDYYLGKDFSYKNKLDYYKAYYKAILIRCKFFYFYIPEIQNCLFESRYKNNIEVYNNISKRNGNYDFGTQLQAIGENEEAKKKVGFRYSKMTDYYLNEMLVLTKQNNIKVYFVIAPFNENSYNKIYNLNKDYLKEYSDYINSLKLKYNNVVWNSDIYCYGNDFFGDPSHLNSKGQRKFSTYIKSYLSGR